MMFKLVFSVFVITVIATGTSGLETSVFQEQKSKLERKMNSKRLGNYLRKMLMKKNNLIDDNLVFIETQDFQALKLDSEINFSNIPNIEDLTELKARIAALKWGKLHFQDENFKPYGVSEDKEEIENWKVFLVLMIGNAGKHKLIKVCLSNEIDSDFTIVSSYDKKCKSIVDHLNKFHVMSDMTLRKPKPAFIKVEQDNNTIRNNTQNNPADNKTNLPLSEQLKLYQYKLEQLKKENEKKEKNIELLKKQNQQLIKLKSNPSARPNSFIEKNFEEASLLMKSNDDVVSEMQPRKFFTLDSLSQKFSVDELKKIKSLIKFAKKNQIMDKIYIRNGEITLSDLANSDNALLSLDSNNKYNLKNTLTSFFKNFTDHYHKEEQGMRQEIDALKKVETEQQTKLQSYFGQMGENVNMIKNLMLFVKELSGEFQKSMLVFGNTLGGISEKIKNVTTKIGQIESKFKGVDSNLNIIKKNSNMTGFSFKQLDKKIDQSLKDLTHNLSSKDELLRLMIENNTRHLLNDYQKNLRKEFELTLNTTLNYIKNISTNLTNIFEGQENLPKTTQPSIHSTKKEISQKHPANTKQKYIPKPAQRRSNLRAPARRIIPKKPERPIDNVVTKDSLEDEDSFDTPPPVKKQVKKPAPKKVSDGFDDDFLEP